MIKTTAWVYLTLAGLALTALPAAAITETGAPAQPAAGSDAADPQIRFQVQHYRVQGNTLLAADLIDRVLAPYAGASRSRLDIQQAAQALEQLYRAAGYPVVRVVTPPQDITDGTVTLVAIEFKLGSVTVSGNRHHDQANILAALPALTPGAVPSSTALAENLRLANENPSRRLDVALALGDQIGSMDARVEVQDEAPLKISLTLDNTGNDSTGSYRSGLVFQHNNLFNRDHAATLSYSTAPGHVRDVTQLSASYRLPLYRWGDSLDFIASYSDVNAGSTTTVAGPMTFSGKGHTYGARYNHYFTRSGDYSARLTASLDYRAYANSCSVGEFGAAGCGSAAADTTVHPIGLTYSGAWSQSALVADFSASASRNLPGGSHGSDADFSAARPSPLGDAGAGASAGYSVYQLNGSLLYLMPQDWRLRVAARSQYTHDALIAGEQFGLSGANTVRGFMEREAARDKGYAVNIEAYTPDLAAPLGASDSALRLLVFADYARGWNEYLAGEADAALSLASSGLGVRYDRGRKLTARLDWGRVTLGAANSKTGEHRAHLSVALNF